ncbi:transposase IS66 family protein [Rhizobium azibense]|nr:transposase IS66 family protein [Rhizobium azibense]
MRAGGPSTYAYRSGEGSEQPIVLFDYQPGRGQEHPQAFLDNYRGILMSDGYSAWRTLKGATHIGCMAHARRRFVDALKARKKPGGPPAQALKFFDQLYRIERQVRDEEPDDGEPQADYMRRCASAFSSSTRRSTRRRRKLSQPGLEIGDLDWKSITALIKTHKASGHTAEAAAVGEHANLRGAGYFH